MVMLYFDSSKYARILIKFQNDKYIFKLFGDDKGILNKIKSDSFEDSVVFHSAKLDSNANLYQIMMSE